MTTREVLSLAGAAVIFALSCFTLATLPTTVRAQTCTDYTTYIFGSCYPLGQNACLSCMQENCSQIPEPCQAECLAAAAYC